MILNETTNIYRTKLTIKEEICIMNITIKKISDFYMNRQENSVIFSHCDELTEFYTFEKSNYIKIPQEVRKFTPMEIL